MRTKDDDGRVAGNAWLAQGGFHELRYQTLAAQSLWRLAREAFEHHQQPGNAALLLRSRSLRRQCQRTVAQSRALRGTLPGNGGPFASGPSVR